MPSQLTLRFAPLNNHEESDFFVSASNEAAVRFITDWPGWNSHAAILWGPEASGKSHLVRIWQARSGAGVIAAGDMSTKAEPKLPLAIEDFDTAPVNEAAIFHALNAAKEHSSYILLTGRTAPGHWKIDLPDLRSRIRSFPAITISQPDDQLIAAIYLKHFSDRQLAIAPDVIPFLMPRVDRSMAAIKATVEEIDRAALAEHRSITRAFVAKLMKTKTEKTQD